MLLGPRRLFLRFRGGASQEPQGDGQGGGWDTPVSLQALSLHRDIY